LCTGTHIPWLQGKSKKSNEYWRERGLQIGLLLASNSGYFAHEYTLCVLQCVAVCCSVVKCVLQCGAVNCCTHEDTLYVAVGCSVLQGVLVCCKCVLQCVWQCSAVWCCAHEFTLRVLQYVVVCCRVSQSVAVWLGVCCSVVQCVAACVSIYTPRLETGPPSYRGTFPRN